MAIRISIRNLNKGIRVNLKGIEEIAGSLLRREFKMKNLDLGITFVNNALMKKINYRFKKKKKPTDVLTFAYGRGLAEIIISSQTARENSKRFNTSFKKELTLYIIHGILHYLGFDDRNKKEKSAMKKKELKLLEKIWRRAPLLTA